ncbi:MAG: LptA/OstA family protein [bacterium]|nr:LptA/OstA family protein [bacterium]MDD5755735.1 LptA/OstA family protein [bacterium]
MKMRKVALIVIFWMLFLSAVNILSGAENKPIDVSSQQMETLEKGKVAFFSGQVKVTQEQGILYADKVWHYLAEDRLEAEGNVHYQEKKEQEITDIYGGKMVFNRKTGYGTVTKSPKIVRQDTANPKNDTTITGDLVEIFNNEKRARVSGNVNIVQPEAKSKSNVADYYSLEKKLVLTGNPWVWQKNQDNISEYTGKVITIYTENERVVIEENVQAKITSIKNEESKRIKAE